MRARLARAAAVALACLAPAALPGVARANAPAVSAVGVSAAAHSPAPPALGVTGACLLDAQSGQILYTFEHFDSGGPGGHAQSMGHGEPSRHLSARWARSPYAR